MKNRSVLSSRFGHRARKREQPKVTQSKTEAVSNWREATVDQPRKEAKHDGTCKRERFKELNAQSKELDVIQGVG
jgi:hypothetical protein